MSNPTIPATLLEFVIDNLGLENSVVYKNAKAFAKRHRDQPTKEQNHTRQTKITDFFEEEETDTVVA